MREFLAFCLILLVIVLVGFVVLHRVQDVYGVYQKGLRDAIQTAIGVEKPQQQTQSE